MLLQSKYDEYNVATMTRKKQILFDIVEQVHAYGGRFLVPTKNCWMETDDETARNKVSVAFRDVRKNMNAKKNLEYTDSVAEGLSMAMRVDVMDFGCM
jgi:uncharacterized protein (DUF1330 family)